MKVVSIHLGAFFLLEHLVIHGKILAGTLSHIINVPTM